MNVETMSVIPILAAFRASDATWEVWCEHCRRWHSHGAGDGHRVAHCVGYKLDRRTGLDVAMPKWEHGYFLSDEHPDADITNQRRRPRLEPLGWHITGLDAQ